MKIFNLPDLGEGLPDAEIVKWHVAVGDTIKQDEPLVSMETAKAVVEVPSPYSGSILKLHGKAGDIIQTGSPLVEFEAKDSVQQRPDTGTVAGKIEVGDKVVTEQATSISKKPGGVKVLPAVRALAKKLNVDLATISPTGPNGTITADDVKKSHQLLSNAGPLQLLKGVRRQMAIAMAQSHAEVVPVTIVEDADISSWVKTKLFSENVITAMVQAIKKEPALNVWYDGQAMGRRMLSEVHLGLAMDTEDGLFVPVIKNAQDLSKEQIREQINSLKKEVTSRTITPEKLQGATIVLSNFGKFAGRYANPIVIPPMVAILGVGALREEVIAVNGDPSVRSILPLSLTFDHRAVTGGEATRFIGWVKRALEGK